MPDYTILLIDYDPRSIERTSGLLVGAGYRVEVAKNGIEGLAAFKRLGPGLVLVEAMLPKKHGFEVCQEIKQSPEGANVPVVIFTAVYRGRKYRSQAFHLYKCDEYLEKPVPDDKLLEAIRTLFPIEAKPEPAAPPKAPEPVKAPVVEAKKAPAAPPKAPEPVKAPTVDVKKAPAAPEAPRKAPEPVKAPAVEVKKAPAAPPKAPEPVEAPAAAASAAPSAPPRAEPAAAKPDRPAPQPARRPRRPRRDQPIAQFTEDDIMSTLDAIMPDEPAPDKTAAN